MRSMDDRRTNSAALLRYDSGSEYAPDDPFGRCVLEVQDDGRARLRNSKRGLAREWEGTLKAGALDELRGGVDELLSADLPNQDVFAPGTTFRNLDVESAAGDRRFRIAWREGSKLRVFQALDGLVRELSGFSLKIDADDGVRRLADS